MRNFLLVFTLIFCWVSAVCQLSPLQQKSITLVRTIEQNHYFPRQVNDSFSVSLFNTLIKIADPRLLLFTEPEYKQMLSFSTRLDDELKGRSSGSAELYFSLYKKALIRADSIIQKVTQKPFDFSTNESISSTREKVVQFSPDVSSLTNKWSRYLKLLTLTQAYNTMKADTQGVKDLKVFLAKNEVGIREKVKTAEQRNIKKILEYPDGFEKYVQELYLNSIASTFDPHTNYFSPEGKQELQSELSSEGLSFGLDIDENDKGQIVVTGLVPGGPAWKSGELHKGDELLQLQWGNKKPVEMNGLSLEDVEEIMDQQLNENLRLKFKKSNGVVKDVSLRKEKMNNDENIVKSFILNGDKKIGYILLPGFYTEWENEQGSSCANDVAKELIKLKREKIDGLILDVRYNGGGSMSEALELAGIFIEEGPMAAIREKTGKLIYLKDPNRGTIYDGPFALMVNGQSASASEMLAATLQDYSRAVIIGSNTYGKATEQQLYPVDSNNRKPFNGDGDKDIVKITNSKLYRITGHSAQLNGVIADIQLPDIYEGLEFGEKYTPNALPMDTVKKNNYYQPLPALPLPELAGLSASRIGNNKEFQEIKEMVKDEVSYRQQKTQTFPLNATAFQQWIEEMEKRQPTAEGKSTESSKKYKVTNHNQDIQLLSNDEYAREINEIWLENISKDIYLEETFSVLIDLIRLQNKQ